MNAQSSAQQQAILSYFLNPVTLPSTQMIESIKTHNNFPQICQQILSAFSDSDEPIPTVNSDYICMKLCEKMAGNDKSQKLNQAIQKLEQLEIQIDCLIYQLGDRYQWVEGKTKQFVDNMQEAKQDCEILAHQNKKLLNEIQQREGMNEGNLSNSKIGEKSELQSLLQKYHCTTGFPKNKNEALRLLNNLEVKLQGLEVQKLALQ